MDDTHAVPPTVSNDDPMDFQESSNFDVDFENQIKNELIQEN